MWLHNFKSNQIYIQLCKPQIDIFKLARKSLANIVQYLIFFLPEKYEILKSSQASDEEDIINEISIEYWMYLELRLKMMGHILIETNVNLRYKPL